MLHYANTSHMPLRVSYLDSYLVAESLDQVLAHLSLLCRRHVANMSPTRDNVAKSWPTLRVVATQKRPRHTQFISITTDKYKSAQTYGYLSYHRVFVFELKQQSRKPTCRGFPDMSSNVVLFRLSSGHDIFLCLRHDQRRVATCRRHDTECRRLGNKNDTPTSDITG